MTQAKGYGPLKLKNFDWKKGPYICYFVLKEQQFNAKRPKSLVLQQKRMKL